MPPGRGHVARGLSIKPVPPKVLPATAPVNALQGGDVFGAGLRPAQARLFVATADKGLAVGFHHPGTNAATRSPEGGILPQAHVANQAARGLYFFFEQPRGPRRNQWRRSSYWFEPVEWMLLHVAMEKEILLVNG